MGKFEFLMQNKFAWELQLPKHKPAQNERIFSALLHAACYALVLLWGLQPGLSLHAAMSTSSQCKVFRGRGAEASISGTCNQDPVPHPGRRIWAWEKLRANGGSTKPKAAHHAVPSPDLPAGLWEHTKWSTLAPRVTCDPPSHSG